MSFKVTLQYALEQANKDGFAWVELPSDKNPLIVSLDKITNVLDNDTNNTFMQFCLMADWDYFSIMGCIRDANMGVTLQLHPFPTQMIFNSDRTSKYGIF